MPVKLETTDQELENVLMRKTHGQPYFNDIRDFLQEGEKCPVPQRCSVEMMKKIAAVLQEELGKKQFRDASAIVSAIQYAARFQDNPLGLPVLLANGLIDLLAYAFDQTGKFVAHSDCSEDCPAADSLMEVILLTVNDVADFNEDAKKEAVGMFTGMLMLFVVHKEKKFHLRMEAIRTLNLLLEGCGDEVIKVIRDFPPSLKQMSLMADLLTTAGDIEMQIACTETLARLVKRSDKDNYNLIQDWFCDQDFAAGFMKIKDDTFETDCRKFLNNMNDNLGSKQSVFSFPCISAHLGSLKLSCPTDVNLKDFWVDFNTVSQRITLYVADEPQEENDEGGMWETVTIHNRVVEKFRLSERGDQQALLINLNIPASELLGFCHSDDKYVQILFDAKLGILNTTVAVFGQDKMGHSKHKTSVSQINIQVHIDGNSSSPGPPRNIRSADESSDCVSIQSANIYGLGGDNDEPPGQKTSRSEVPTKRKVSVAHSPMWTPTMAKRMAAQGSSVCSGSRSASSLASHKSGVSVKPLHKKSDFTQPKTPVRPNSSSTKRVKTPLQIVISDKATDSANESVASCRSIGKKSSISSGISISSCGTPTRLRQKLQQEASKKPHLMELSGFQDAEPDTGSRSDPGPASSKSIPQAVTQNGYHGQSDGQRSDPGPVSSGESPPQQRRQLRNRINKAAPPKASSAMKHQEPQGNSVEHQGEEQVSSGGEKDSKTKKPSRKFRLYSDNGGMLMENKQGEQDALETDVVIPSSIPTQESVVDIIPDSLPPSGQLQSNITAARTAVPSRIQLKEEEQETDIKKTKAADSKASVPKTSKPLPPSRAFRKVPPLTPQSSQELSQLDFTSQMEAHPKRGRPKKGVDKVKKQPKKRGGKSVKERPAAEEPKPRARSQRAAAKAAQGEIQKLSQSFDDSSEASSDPDSAQEPINPAKRSVPAKEKGLLQKSTPDTIDLSVYDFADSESCASVGLKPRIRKKRSPMAKAAKNTQAKRKVPAKHVVPSKKSLSPVLSDTEQPRVASNRKYRNPSDRLVQSPKEPSDTGDDKLNDAGRRYTRRNTNKPPPSPEELSDIEQPRDAAPMTSSPQNMQLSSSVANIDQYSDEDVQSFVESLTGTQRQFLERKIPRRGAAEAFSELLLENRKNRQDNSGQKANRQRTQSGPRMEQPSNTSPEASTDREKRMKASYKEQTSSRKMPPRSKRNFGVEIVEVESEEVANREDPVIVSSDDHDATDNVSVENFSKVCENIVKKSGRRLGATRSNINYQNKAREAESNDEVEKTQQERENSGAISPEPLPHSSKKRTESDAVSERSWLAEKPKQKVTTYSKTQSKTWVPQPYMVNPETTFKKQPRQRREKLKRKQRGPPAVQRKKQKKPTPRDSQDSDVEGLGACMYYYQKGDSSFSDSQPGLQSPDQSLLNKSQRSNKTVKSAPQIASTPRSLQSSEEDKESSIEIARDVDNTLEYEDPFPITPLVLVDDIRADLLPDLVTPKSLTIPSISSRCSSSSGKTPKQVTFDSNPDYAEDSTPEVHQDEPVKSGPSSLVRPTTSTLKRKYGDLFNDDEGDESQEDIEQDVDVISDNDNEVHPSVSAQHNSQGSLRPKKLFKGAVSSPTLPLEEDAENSDDNSNDALLSSPQSHSSLQMQIKQMMNAISQKMKRKMQTKQSQARQLTDGAVRTTQTRVSKLWSQQHQARSNAQEEFKNCLLEQIVSLEDELGHLKTAYSKLQSILEQHCRKTSSTLLTHVDRMKSLHNEHEAESRELNNQLGRHLLHNVRQILSQQMVNMQKQVIQDTQQDELEQMKKRLQTMFKF
ncbi:uncharacterized protein LOC119729273 [Patiria miniata]|uniref:Synaptonemal complex protein 2-like n=1 Tax=Patiria miniata TaxID=46514 RepID=A0A914A2D2_PATMI|nr:uncharacterized protein LOC119729273 [Patiria miniata]